MSRSSSSVDSPPSNAEGGFESFLAPVSTALASPNGNVEAHLDFDPRRFQFRSSIKEFSEQLNLRIRELKNAQLYNQETHSALRKELEIVRQKISFLRDFLAPGAGQSNGNDQLFPRLIGIQDTLEKLQEESQLLKVALFNDQIQRQEREAQESVEEMDLQVRVSRLETKISRFQSLLSETQSFTQRATELVGRRSVATPTIRKDVGSNAPPQHLLLDLKDLRESHVHLAGKVESVSAFCLQEEAKRRATVTSLEVTVKELEGELKRMKNKDGGQWPVFSASTPGQYRQESTSTSKTPLHVLRDRVCRFYEIFNPLKISDIDRILEEYEGAEEELLAALEVHYGAFGFFSN